MVSAAEAADQNLKIFARPVSAVGYTKIIADPVDLTLIKSRVAQKLYASLDEAVQDVLRMFDNAELYNGADSVYGKEAQRQRAIILDVISDL